LPLIVTAIDKDGNDIGQTTESYTISVLSGQGKISDGASSNNSIQFDNFSKAGFIYQAPKGITANIAVNITVAPTPTKAKLLAIQPTTAISGVQKNIIVAKGIITIFKDGKELYQTDKEQAIEPLTFDLPKDESDIQYQDANEILQINPDNIPHLRITIKDKNDNLLDSVASITSEQGLLTP